MKGAMSKKQMIPESMLTTKDKVATVAGKGHSKIEFFKRVQL